MLSYQSLKNTIKAVPFVRSLQEYKTKKHFAGDCYGCFWGVFENFEQAIQAAPKTKKMGYNHPELAQEYKTKLNLSISPSDYPMIFWLKEILQDNWTVFDFGGNVGDHFYKYEKYITYPTGLKWNICDLPEINKAGESLAKEKNRNELFFSDVFEIANDAEVFLASGSIQYVEHLDQSLSRLSKKPRHILINKLPLSDGSRFVTLQNGGQVFYPQYVFNKKEFIDSISNIGYQLIDLWQDRVHSCKVLSHPEKSVRYYSGLYLKLRE